MQIKCGNERCTALRLRSVSRKCAAQEAPSVEGLAETTLSTTVESEHGIWSQRTTLTSRSVSRRASCMHETPTSIGLAAVNWRHRGESRSCTVADCTTAGDAARLSTDGTFRVGCTNATVF